MSTRILSVVIMMVLSILVTGCAKETGKKAFETPEAAFGQIQKAMVNRDPDLMWDCLGGSWKAIFDKGRQELVAQPAEEKEKIAKAGMVSAKDIDEMDTRDFFQFYFNYKKKEVYSTNAPEIIEKKTDLIKGATIDKVNYLGDKTKAYEAEVVYKMDGDSYKLSMLKTKGAWLLHTTGDSMDAPLP